MLVPMFRRPHPKDLHQILNLRRRKVTGIESAQQQIEFCSLLQLLDRKYRGFQRIALDHRAVIGEQHGGVFSGQALDRLGNGGIAGPIIRHERSLAAFHQVIGRHRG